MDKEQILPQRCLRLGIQKNYFHKKLFSFFKEKITYQPIKILDCGCAPGNWARWFKEEFDAGVFGIDTSPAGLEQSRQKVAEGVFLLADVQKTEMVPKNWTGGLGAL